MPFNAGDIEGTLTLDRSPFQRGLREARAEAAAFEKRKIHATLEVDSRGIEKINRDMERLSRQRKGVQIHVDVSRADIEHVKEVIDRIGDNTETTARRSGSRMARALLNPLVIQLGLLPAIAMASAAASAVAMGALVVGFGAIAIAATKNNAQVRQAYSEMWTGIKEDTRRFAAPLTATWVEVAGDIEASWRTIGPQLEGIFKTIDPMIKNVSNGILGMAEEAVPRFATALTRSGPIMDGFESLLVNLGAGFGEMAVNMTEHSLDMGRSTELLGQFLRGLLGDVGSLIDMFGSFWADIGPQFNRVFDKMMDAVLKFTSGGLTAFGHGLTVVLGILEAVLNIIGPFSDILGGITGYLLAGAAAWKLFAGGAGLFATAFNALAPSKVMGRLSGTTSAIDKMSAATGGWVTKVSGSEKAGERFSGAMTKVGNAVTRTASALPILGLALAASAAVVDHFWPSADDLADSILKGGEAAETARGKMQGLHGQYQNNTVWASAFAASAHDVADAVNAQLDSMTAVERAQALQSQAQNDYDLMVKRHGATSGQASIAQEHLAFTTEQVAAAQRAAHDATLSTTQAMLEQTNLMLGAVGAQLNYQSSLLALEASQKSLNQAIKEHGRGSIEARQADTAYQQNLLSVIQAVGARAQAEAEARGEIDASKFANQAMRGEIVRLAVAAGKTLPPALATMVAGFSDSELAAFGVKRTVDKTGTSIKLLPGVKAIKFPTDAPQTQTKVSQLANAVNGVPTTHYITFYMSQIGAPPQVPAKGFGPGLGMLGTVPRRAGGGPVKAKRPYWVGDAGMPELMFPDVDGFVLNGRDSAKLSQGKGITRGVGHNPLTPETQSDADQADVVNELAERIGAAVARNLDGTKLRVSGPEWAKLVNEANASNGRR